jgi:hypothetical protein
MTWDVHTLLHCVTECLKPCGDIHVLVNR